MKRRQQIALLTWFATIAFAAPLVAQPKKTGDDATRTACISSYEQVQSLRDSGQLIEARDRAIACSRDECPKALSKQCAEWLDQIADSTPTVVVGATGPSGQDLTDVRLSVDGKPLSEQLGSRALPVNPGSHTFQFDSSQFGHVDLTVVLREGERNRRVVAMYTKAGGAPAPDTESTWRPVPTAAWVLLGVAGAGAIIGATFEGLGLAKKGSLDQKKCAPFCQAPDVNTMTRDFAVGDVSLAVGIASAASAVVVILTRPELRRAAATSPVHAAFAVVPEPHGAFVLLTGQFL